MHWIAGHYIVEQGLSAGARWVLGGFSGLFGLMLLPHASAHDWSVFHSSPSAFCVLVATVCVVEGSLRRFFGSMLAVMILMVCFWLFWQVWLQELFLLRTDPDRALHRILFLSVGGCIPAVMYIWDARFGIPDRWDLNLFGERRLPAYDWSEDLE